jgi:hypothetical protein
MPRSRRNTEPADIKRPFPESEDATYTVEKAWILKTPVGTRCACVHMEVWFESRAHEDIRRQDVQAYAMRKAYDMWVARWGRLDWDLAQFVVSHTTLQVVVELKVEPL